MAFFTKVLGLEHIAPEELTPTDVKRAYAEKLRTLGGPERALPEAFAELREAYEDGRRITEMTDDETMEELGSLLGRFRTLVPPAPPEPAFERVDVIPRPGGRFDVIIKPGVYTKVA